MKIVFTDQAWDEFSKDVEKDGGISQYIIYTINRINKKDVKSDDPEECVSQVGNSVICYEIANDKIIIRSIEKRHCQ